MLATGFFLLFVACIVYMHTDMAISKTSASYLAKLQWDEVHIIFLLSRFMRLASRIASLVQEVATIFAKQKVWCFLMDC